MDSVKNTWQRQPTQVTREVLVEARLNTKLASNQVRVDGGDWVDVGNALGIVTLACRYMNATDALKLSDDARHHADKIVKCLGTAPIANVVVTADDMDNTTEYERQDSNSGWVGRPKGPQTLEASGEDYFCDTCARPFPVDMEASAKDICPNCGTVGISLITTAEDLGEDMGKCSTCDHAICTCVMDESVTQDRAQGPKIASDLGTSEDLDIDDHASVVSTVDGTWMILIDGIQYGENRDASGAGDMVFPTRDEAVNFYHGLNSIASFDDEQETPSDDDIVIKTEGPLGSMYTAYQNGKQIAKAVEWDDVAKQILASDQGNFLPTVWFQDDHGGMQIVSLAAKKKAMGPNALFECMGCGAPMGPLDQSHFQNGDDGEEIWNCPKKEAATFAPGDETEVTEFILYAENTSELYPQFMSIIENLKRKIKRGVYDPTLAPKLWRYWFDEAARRYRDEFGVMFSTGVRQAAAEREAADVYEQIMNGEFGEVMPTAPKPETLTEGDAPVMAALASDDEEWVATRVGEFVDEMEAEDFMVKNYLENGHYHSEGGKFVVYNDEPKKSVSASDNVPVEKCVLCGMEDCVNGTRFCASCTEMMEAEKDHERKKMDKGASFSDNDECSRCGEIGPTNFHVCQKCADTAQEKYRDEVRQFAIDRITNSTEIPDEEKQMMLEELKTRPIMGSLKIQAGGLGGQIRSLKNRLKEAEEPGEISAIVDALDKLESRHDKQKEHRTELKEKRAKEKAENPTPELSVEDEPVAEVAVQASIIRKGVSRTYGIRTIATQSKCIKCNQRFPVAQMVKNVYGAGYLCKVDAVKWNKNNTDEEWAKDNAKGDTTASVMDNWNKAWDDSVIKIHEVDGVYVPRTPESAELLKEFTGKDSFTLEEYDTLLAQISAAGYAFECEIDETASLKVSATDNSSVISMFINDAFPKDKNPEWGTPNLRISKQPGGWALVNYATPLLFRSNSSDELFFNTDKYSVSTSRIQNMIRQEVGGSATEIDEAGIQAAIEDAQNANAEEIGKNKNLVEAEMDIYADDMPPAPDPSTASSGMKWVFDNSTKTYVEKATDDNTNIVPVQTMP